CPEYSRCIQISPYFCECWCKYFYPGRPEVDACKNSDGLLDHLAEVTIRQTDTQPDSPIKFRRDQTRMLVSSFNLEITDSGQASFHWRIENLMLSPFNISDEPELLVYDTLELYIGPKLLLTGLKLVTFELRVNGIELAARDFAFLQVEKSALVAYIAGGTEIMRSINKPISVDASSSYDPEKEDGTSPGLNFNWFCFKAATRNVSEVNDTVTSVLVNASGDIFNALLDSSANGTLFQLPDDVFTHSFEKGKVHLDTKKLKNNETYYVVLTIRHDSRAASVMQTVHTYHGELVDVRIRCILNCVSPASASSGISARTDCLSTRCPKSLTYRWKMFSKNGSYPYSKWMSIRNFSNLLATKVDSRNLVIKQQSLIPGSSYRITVDVQSPNGSHGWAAYQFDTSEAPSGGTCHGTQLDKEAAIGVWLNITCRGWKDDSLPLRYEFYREIEDGALYMLSYGVRSYSVVHISPSVGEDLVRFKVAIVNVVGVASEERLSIKVNRSSLTQSEELLYVQIKQILTAMDNYFSVGQINMVIQEADSLLALLDAAGNRIDEKFLLYTKDYVMSKIFNVRVDNLERLVQIAVILGKSMDNAVDVYQNTTFAVLDKLLEMTSLLSLTTERRSETRLIANAGRSLLYCNTNIMKYSSLRILMARNSTNYGQQNEVIMWKTISGLCQNLTEKIINTLLSLKVPGEEYSVIKNDLQSTILGKKESHELNQLTIQDGNASFELPSLDDKTLEKMLGNISEVGVEMIDYNFNPYTSHNSSKRVRSRVISLALKDDNGDALQVTNLPSDIQMNIPISHHDPSSTSHPANTDDFLNPGSMKYHVITAREVNTTIKLSITMKTLAAVTAYIKFGEHPTQTSYDEVIELSEENKVVNVVSDCELTEKCSYDIFINCNVSGQYYIGLLGNNGNRTVHSRGRRSVLSEGASQEKCVKFKDPPPTIAPPAEYTILVPEYDPDRSVNYSLQVDTIWCAYWSDTEERWTNEGCKVGQKSNSSSLTCLCNHLTAFGGDVLVAPNTVDFEMVQQAFDNLDPKTLLVLITVCSVFLVYLVVLVILRRADNLDVLKDSPLIVLAEHQAGKYKYEISITTGGWKNSGTTANVSMILHGTENISTIIKLTNGHSRDRNLFARGNTDNFLLHLEKPLGTITSVQIGHDTSGDDPSWFLSEILIVDSQTDERWMFSCYRWLALERDDGNTTSAFYTDNYKGDDEFKRTFSALRKNGFSDDHLWFSVISKQPRNHFTRVQRVSCCWCLLMLSMVTSAMFYETESTTQQKIKIGPLEVTSSQLIIALESAMIVLPASLLIVLLFRKSEPKINTQGRRYHLTKSETKQQCVLPHFCVYIAWFLCVCTGITSALFTVFYSLMWGGEKSARWLTTVVLSLSGDVIISQPIKIILASVIIAFRCGCGKKTTGKSKTAEEKSQEPFHTAVDLSSIDIERARKYKVNERKMYAYMRELVFSLLFFMLLLIVCYGDKNEHRYNLNAATESDFQYFDDRGQYKITNVTQFWGWLKNVFVPAIFTADSYKDQEETASEYIGNNRSILVGMPRLRQLRVKK
ncbi:polycystin-1-related protein-like, partial [Oculina patagonica]